MKSFSTTDHTLEISENGSTFHQPIAGMYRPAVLLAYYGRINEALESAHKIRLENYGHMGDTKFRVVTKTKTISYEAGSFEEFCE